MAFLLPMSFPLPSISLAFQAFKRPVATGMAVWKAWRRQAENRATLLHIDDHLCRDIGVSSERLTEELRRPWWRDPQLRRDLRN